MTRHLIFFLTVFILLLISFVPASACSSYAVYSNLTMYGVNFDLPGNPEILFTMEQGTGPTRFFSLSFQTQGVFRRMAGMNSTGLLASLQMVPARSTTVKPGESTLLIADLHAWALQNAATIDDIKAHIKGKRITHVPGFDLHVLFADRHGRVLVLEIGESENRLVENTVSHMAMTNFYVSDFPGQPAGSMQGPGADRYRATLAGLQANMGRFDLDNGFGILQKSLQPFTLVSLVFLPEQQKAWFALGGDFRKIWAVDLNKETIATYRGFAQTKAAALNGVTGTDLRTWR